MALLVSWFRVTRLSRLGASSCQPPSAHTPSEDAGSLRPGGWIYQNTLAALVGDGSATFRSLVLIDFTRPGPKAVEDTASM